MKNLSNYYDPHRFYHNLSHIEKMLDDLKEIRGLPTDELLLLEQAITYHDVVYDPRRTDNELKSIEYMYYDLGATYPIRDLNRIAELIRSTIPDTYITRGDDKLVKIMRYLDCKAFYDNDIIQLIANFKLLLKEYQFVDYDTFVEKHLLFFNRFSLLLNVSAETRKQYQKYVLCYRPKIGVYAGSFNPFHIGHMSVLEQAERIFDKVMVVFPSNIKAPIQVGKTLPFHEVVAFDGLLTDYVNKLKQKTNADFTLIRGMRNGNDLEYEVNLNKAYKDLGSDLNVMYFMTDFPHVSSSMVREIIKVSPRYKLYIPDKYSYAGAIE